MFSIVICSAMIIYFAAIASAHGVVFSYNPYCKNFLKYPWGSTYYEEHMKLVTFHQYGINIFWMIFVCIIGWVSCLRIDLIINICIYYMHLCKIVLL